MLWYNIFYIFRVSDITVLLFNTAAACCRCGKIYHQLRTGGVALVACVSRCILFCVGLEYSALLNFIQFLVDGG